MAKKINVKLIMELKASGLSQNVIAKTRHISKTSICDVLNIAKEKQIFYDDIKDKPDDEVYRLFYPDKFAVVLCQEKVQAKHGFFIAILTLKPIN